MLFKQNLSIDDIPGESWRDVVGYEGLYLVSNFGRIKSVERVVYDSNGKPRRIRQKIKKYAISKYGYLVVSLCKDSVTNTRFVHRIIAIAFLPNPMNKPCIDHKNRNTLDYSLDNISWVTQKENINNPNSVEYCLKNVNKKALSALANETKRKKGTKTAPRRVYQYALDGTFVEEYESMNDAERKTGLCSSGIGAVINNPAYTFGGFLWASTRRADYKHSPSIHPFYKPVRKISPDGEIIGEWPSMTKAAKALGVSRKYIDKGLIRGEFVFFSM